MQAAPDLTVSLVPGHTHEPGTPWFDRAHPLKGFAPGHAHAPGAEPVRLYYEVHGLAPGESLADAAPRLPRVVMIMGLACGCSGWRWQLQDLVASHLLTPNVVASPSDEACAPRARLPLQRAASQEQAAWQEQHEKLTQRGAPGQAQEMLVAILDNRGIGLSTAPKAAAAYSTQIMAQDVLALMDLLGWASAHILGFSMGGFIAQALAVTAPHRVNSLTLLGTSAGGWQILPSSLPGLRAAWRLVTARTPEDAVDATLHLHFRRSTLRRWVSHLAQRRLDVLRREYLRPSPDVPPQTAWGFQGQLRACWRHRLSEADARAIRGAGFPVLVIHGRNDKLASAARAEQLARRLAAPCFILPAAHFLVREMAGTVNKLLSSLVLAPCHIASIANEHYLDPDPA